MKKFFLASIPIAIIVALVAVYVAVAAGEPTTPYYDEYEDDYQAQAQAYAGYQDCDYVHDYANCHHYDYAPHDGCCHVHPFYAHMPSVLELIEVDWDESWDESEILEQIIEFVRQRSMQIMMGGGRNHSYQLRSEVEEGLRLSYAGTLESLAALGRMEGVLHSDDVFAESNSSIRLYRRFTQVFQSFDEVLEAFGHNDEIMAFLDKVMSAAPRFEVLCCQAPWIFYIQHEEHAVRSSTRECISVAVGQEARCASCGAGRWLFTNTLPGCGSVCSPWW